MVKLQFRVIENSYKNGQRVYFHGEVTLNFPKDLHEILRFLRYKKLCVVEEHSADNKFIECAQSANADYIISGDKHLLKVACYKKTQIVSVREFIQIITKK